MSQYPPPPQYTASGPPPVVYQPNVSPVMIPVMVGTHMGPLPATTTCRSCNRAIVTRVEYKPSLKTHLFAMLLCLVFLPCVFIPYCMNSCHNADHFCPNCNAYVGTYID